MLHFDSLLNAFVTLMVTIDPPGLAPIFLALTQGMTRPERLSAALRGTVIAFVVLLMFLLIGSAVLETLGITIHAFRVAGGLLLFYISFEMIFEKRQQRHEKTSERAITSDYVANLAVFPLAVLLIAGPGAISATVLLSSQLGSEPVTKAALCAILAAAMAIVLFSLFIADRIDKYLGATGRTILTRLLGLLLAALSVQFVADGVIALAKGAAA